jgi:hypothetical protein
MHKSTLDLRKTVLNKMCMVSSSHGQSNLCNRSNSWTKSRQKSKEFSSLLSESPIQYSFALRFLFFVTLTQPLSYFFTPRQPLTFSTVKLLYTVKEKEGKPYPLPYVLRNPYRNLKSENSQDYAQKPQRNCTFMNLTSGFNSNIFHIVQSSVE